MTDYHSTPKGTRIGAAVKTILGTDMPDLSGGLCATIDPDAWFPGKGGPNKKQKAICHRCPVEQACRDWAIDNFELGIWGGTSDEDRKEIRRKQKQKRTKIKDPAWRCGHPKTPANTAKRGTRGRCRICRNAAANRSRINRSEAA